MRACGRRGRVDPGRVQRACGRTRGADTAPGGDGGGRGTGDEVAGAEVGGDGGRAEAVGWRGRRTDTRSLSEAGGRAGRGQDGARKGKKGGFRDRLARVAGENNGENNGRVIGRCGFLDLDRFLVFRARERPSAWGSLSPCHPLPLQVLRSLSRFPFPSPSPAPDGPFRPPRPSYPYSRLYAPFPLPALSLILLILGRCKLHPYHVHKPCPPRP